MKKERVLYSAKTIRKFLFSLSIGEGTVWFLLCVFGVGGVLGSARLMRVDKF